MAHTAAAALVAINPADEYLDECPRPKRAPSQHIDYDALQDRAEEAMLRSLVARKQNRGRPGYWS